MRWIVLSFAALLIASSARADWQYTRWGMTPEQVVAASGGKAELLPEKERPRIPPLTTAAKGYFEDGALRLRTTFSFNTEGGGLMCVWYGVGNHADDDAFKAMLIKRYGPPQSKSGIAFLGQENLSWKTATDQIDATFSKDDTAYAMHCGQKR
jgi:hypothetical protein